MLRLRWRWLVLVAAEFVVVRVEVKRGAVAEGEVASQVATQEAAVSVVFALSNIAGALAAFADVTGEVAVEVAAAVVEGEGMAGIEVEAKVDEVWEVYLADCIWADLARRQIHSAAEEG